MNDAEYLQYIDRLSKIPPTMVASITSDGSITQTGGVIVDSGIIHDLVIYQHTLEQQATLIASQIMWWGAMRSRAQRVWQIVSRDYAIWKAQKRLALEGAPHPTLEGKKTTKAAAEDLYRTDPEYLTQNIAVESAEEAYNVCDMAVEAFKAKQWMLNRDAKRANDQTL